MNIVLIHGFNVRDGGKGTIDTLEQPLILLGHDPDKDRADYGWHWLFKVRFNHKKDVQRIANALLWSDAAFTHSNGANYFNQACRIVYKHDPEKKLKVVHFSPAIDNDAEIPKIVTHMVIFATPHDSAVKWADKLWFHKWGNAGRVGYAGSDNRGSTVFFPTVLEHSGWFEKPDFFAGEAMEAIG